jgi:hypothetical protein
LFSFVLVHWIASHVGQSRKEQAMSEHLDKQFMEASDGMAGLSISSTPYDLDPSRYLGEVADFDMSEEQKIELLQTLWSIMRSFVELGFKGDACELIFGDCAKHLAEESVGEMIKDHNPADEER